MAYLEDLACKVREALRISEMLWRTFDRLEGLGVKLRRYKFKTRCTMFQCAFPAYACKCVKTAFIRFTQGVICCSVKKSHLYSNDISSAWVEGAHSTFKLLITSSTGNYADVVRLLNLANNQRHFKQICLAYYRSYTQLSQLGGKWAEVYRSILHINAKPCPLVILKITACSRYCIPYKMSALQPWLIPFSQKIGWGISSTMVALKSSSRAC